LKIVSFLPSATEMVCLLGLTDQLVGITHECDYPAAIRQKPVVVRNALDLEKLSRADIDKAVNERLSAGQSLYRVDEELLRRLSPDLLLTQNLCEVCAPSGNEVSQVLNSLPKKPDILWMTPKSLAQIFDNIRDLGAATGRSTEAQTFIAAAQARLNQIAARARSASTRPRVFCMEWIDPVYCSGHWVPEMVELAGGEDRLGRKGTDSVRIDWAEVVNWDPEVLVVSPCGFHLDKSARQAKQLASYPGWSELSAVRQGAVYAVDASSYFARPGPRIVDGVELLAHLIHPELFDWKGPSTAYQKIS
jgi:iron complex transport system substrate-binding protein